MNSREELIDHLKNQSDVLRSPNLESAFSRIDRADFVLESYQPEAYEDYALPMSENETISQPTTVAFMLELLDLQPEDRVIDVGSGSGWTTALMAHVVGVMGEVLGIEINDDLLEYARENIRKYDFPQAQIVKGAEVDLNDQYFDKILFSASLSYIPERFIYALREDGLLVAPMRDSITLYRKQEGSLFEEKSFPGFSFTPFVYDEES